MKKVFLPALIITLIIISGATTGYFLSSGQLNKKTIAPDEIGEKIEKGMVFGVDNPKIFRDNTEGIIEINDGSFTDEGTHKLLREGGESKTAYLISSTLDLDKFVNRKVKIWGETFAAQKAGWLLDVGRLEVLE